MALMLLELLRNLLEVMVVTVDLVKVLLLVIQQVQNLFQLLWRLVDQVVVEAIAQMLT